MKNKILLLLSVIFVLLASTVFASEPQTLSENVYYSDVHFYKEQNGQLEEQFKAVVGDMICRYTVTNDNAEVCSYAAVCGVYDSNNAMISVKSQSEFLAAGESKMFSLSISVPSGGSVKVYLVSDVNVRTPITTLETLSQNSSEKEVTVFSAGDYNGIVDSKSHRISIALPSGKSLADYDVNIGVSSGASAEFTDDTVTVTAENGTINKYLVEVTRIAESIICDFEDGTVGEPIIGLGADTWTQSDLAVVEEEDGNKIVKMTDNDGDGTSGLVSALRMANTLSIKAPFVISCRVRYGYLDGITERDKINNYAYSSFQVRNDSSNNLCAFQPVQSGAGYVFQYLNNGSYTGISSAFVEANEWYTVTMKYYEDGSDMYVDYTFADDKGNEWKASKIKSASSEQELNTLYITTSTLRQSVMSYDDITIKEIDTNAVETYNGGSFAVNADKTISTSVFGGSSQVDFDFTAENMDDVSTLFSMGTASDDVCRIMLNSRELEYICNDDEYPFYISLAPETKYHFSIRYIDDAIYKKPRIAVFLDGECIGELIPFNKTDGVSRFTFGKPSSGKNSIGDFTVSQYR